MLIGYGNSSFGEANIGTWNTISVLLRYRSPYDKKLYLKLTVNGVKVNQLIAADEDFSGPSFINANVYLSQPGLPPMHGQIRNLEFSKF